MTKKAFLIGGLAAGAAIFIFGFLSAGFLLTAEFQAVFASVDLEAQGTSIFILHTAIRFLQGFAAFSVFALCGLKWAGPRALFAAVAIVWTLLYLPAIMLFNDLGLLGLTANAKIGAYGVIEIALAVMAGHYAAGKINKDA